MNNTDDLTSRIQFIESHVGGKQDDTVNMFKDQKELIDRNTSDYARLIDYYNKLERTKNENDNYIERIILSEIEIDYIKNILNGAEWIDGILSTSNMSPKKKNNMECIVSHSTTEANKIIMDAVNKDQIFFD